MSQIAARAGMTESAAPARPDGSTAVAGLIDNLEQALRPTPGTDAQSPPLTRVIDELPVAVYTTDAEGRITYFNRCAARLAGREPLIGQDQWSVAHRIFTPDGDEIPHSRCPMALALREGRPVRGVEVVAQRPDGSRMPFLPFPTPLFDEAGRLIGGFNVLIDISKRKQAEQQAAHLARHDLLTGLPNRQAFDQHLAHRLAQADRRGGRVLLMRIDLDGFKALNDEFGHGWGDVVLVEIARRLGALGGDAFPARTGGDEFMLVLDAEEDADAAAMRARRIREALRGDVLIDGLSLPVGVSAGCALYPQDGASATRLVAAANAALHFARSEGSGLRMFDLAQHRRESERANLREHLRRALAKGEIGLHYQPQFRADGQIEGFEALARWRDPVRGVIAPDEFIPAAEEGGLIVALGAHVLRSACREAAGWANPLRIGVNVSAVQIQAGDLPALVEEVLAETGLDPDRLELEVTEGVMITEPEQAMECLCRLRALGVRIALDDFGTGYSSLSYLHRFPLTTLKIDRSFVANLGVTLESVAITRAIIQLGQALGIVVVGEGVETPEQLDFLIQEGCDLSQGFLLGRPMPAASWASVTGGRRAA